jgi:hypothetical protein
MTSIIGGKNWIKSGEKYANKMAFGYGIVM